MNNFILTIYFIVIGTSIYYQNLLLTILFLATWIIHLSLLPIFRKIRKQNIKTSIENNIETININKASWWEFEELPCFIRVQAKKAVWIRKKNGLYASKQDFYEKNQIDKENQEKIDNIIFIK